jgi:hypothetical protein
MNSAYIDFEFNTCRFWGLQVTSLRLPARDSRAWAR